ncbi:MULTISPECIES: aspartate carbamoyltransferase regulatory subunit [unclassified Anaerotruncus]|jgi:aspartate carbamoyltransferase regulatory subunit|uniref:aspartate carbamoyltransferase regulatory subunit n=1 Tax=unclassified Anaerotruncus TaxID=2641626 RepID=UPI000339B78C|nr:MULTISPECIES: aspartate carbamoyltransferase regulatory subunit [unclassified Anaerotruncus]MCI9160680.1 aspartate carbamoyltransferase regulatory subunit [Anaerotruncus sp.]NCE73605.1 aspartate carbamoyltransferase regulatory subunit [Anaerotruncus sp. X29]RKJ97471.1 aspartate carbamoyltransferase regulatory subunit [Anaerotruncus sp. 1XD22-93]EOS56431.1 aspartate carbamoyltransferase, regulatory subunit [Anaerotruncus sp. G3(2012)]MCI9234693.1 aspartate carbamoyltransferase regulatory sub
MNVDSLQKGLVIDHIQAGKSMEIYRFLDLDRLDCSVAIIKNARSGKSGKKDIIKIEDKIDVDLDVLGFIDPNITVNVVEGGRITRKRKLQLPAQVTNVAKCKNPRCITSIEQELPHIFKLSEEGDRRVYRCIYCEQEYNPKK